MLTTQNQNPQLVFHERALGRTPGYSEICRVPGMESAEVAGAELYHDGSGPKVFELDGADVDSTALYAAFVAVATGMDVRMRHRGLDGSRVVVISGEEPTREEVRAIPKVVRCDIKRRLDAVKGLGHLSRRERFVIGARARAASDQCRPAINFAEVA